MYLRFCTVSTTGSTRTVQSCLDISCPFRKRCSLNSAVVCANRENKKQFTLSQQFHKVWQSVDKRFSSIDRVGSSIFSATTTSIKRSYCVTRVNSIAFFIRTKTALLLHTFQKGMMTASPSMEPLTSTNATAAATTTTPDGIVSSHISRIYHSIRTSSPRDSFSSIVTSTQQHDNTTTEASILLMKKHCSVDPPARHSDGEESDGDDDSDTNLDDPPYDWSSISSMEEDDDDFSLTDAAAHQQEEETPSKSQCRKVTFGMMEIYEVPALSDYMMDDNTSFWYTTMDMISTRRAGRLATMNDVSVKNYLYYYEFLYRKLQNNNETYSNQELLLTELDAKILAYGLRGGYQGLERESKFEHIRQQERRNIVKLIVDVYNSMKVEHAQKPQPTTFVTTENNDDSSQDNDEALRTFAVSLTSTMSKWAVSLGQAAHLAID